MRRMTMERSHHGTELPEARGHGPRTIRRVCKALRLALGCRVPLAEGSVRYRAVRSRRRAWRQARYGQTLGEPEEGNAAESPRMGIRRCQLLAPIRCR